MHPDDSPDVQSHPVLDALLDAERELTPAEQRTLRTLAGAGWAHLNRMLARRAEAVYAMATPEQFGHCLFDHMSIDDRAELVLADAYHCPECGALLKDRNTPIASSVLIERRRLKHLWTQVETAAPEEREQALATFRASLGD